jgi:hypothetical protein
MGAEDQKQELALVRVERQSLSRHSAGLVERGLASLITEEKCSFRFPKDRSIGDLFVGDFEEQISAQGDVLIQSGEMLCFRFESAEEDLKYLQQLSDLRELELSGPNVTDAGLTYISELLELQHLDLAEAAVSDAGLGYLARLRNLHYLSLRNTRVSDSGIKHLVGLEGLRELDLSETNVTDSGLFDLRRALPNCRVLH